VIGRVTIGRGSTIWPQAVLRGDYGEIRIGEDTSIQDGTVVHATDTLATVVGDRCVVGHMVHLEGCTIESDSLVGNGSIVLHRAVVRTGSLVGSNAVVTNDMEVPTGAMALGIPAKVRENAVPPGTFRAAAAQYAENGRRYRRDLRRLD